MKRHFILATAGHVDHGKSSLVKALTGIDPDRLPEEKARGITIELGFAYLDLSDEQNRDSQYRFGIVDVPGHEDFVKNMVAGVGSVDLALLVVAADDGWMPQTEEHLQILTYLGVSHLVVALTKVDLPSLNEQTAINSVRQQLSHTPFEKVPIVPVSNVTGRGIVELKSTLMRVASQTPPPRDIGKPRLSVDRVFTLHGIGTVVTGTLTGGTFTTGQMVIIQPTGNKARIRTIQTHNEAVASASPGMRVALNLADVSVNSRAVANSPQGVSRGDVITVAELGQPGSTLDVLLTRSSRLGQNKTPPHLLKDGARVRVHHGSVNCAARISLLAGREVLPATSAIAQLCLEGQLFTFVNDRFIIRDWPEQTTLAGGVVLDEKASRKNVRDPSRRLFLQKCSETISDPGARVKVQLEYNGLVTATDFLVKSVFSAAEIDQAIAAAEAGGNALRTGAFIADPYWWTKLRRRASDAIDAIHRAHPDRIGLALSELRSILLPGLPFSEAFEALLKDLGQNGFVQAGTVIKRATHLPALPPHLQDAGARLKATLALRPLEPPSRLDLARVDNDKQVLRFLIETGEVVELDTETVILKDAFAKATSTIKGFLTAHPTGTVSELRQAVGTSRRIMVPLLEKLDALGVTKRQGDQRVLRHS